ncbi:MAG: hypothetical protein ACI9TB_002251, partial [Parasphingorhabdus sp.]
TKLKSIAVSGTGIQENCGIIHSPICKRLQRFFMP